jgi:mRNA-degrading endonuclease toxin of MazEF toxin-antitoxin module
LKPFEIFYWQPSGWPEPHPCVIVSHPDRAARKDVVDVLACSTQRAGRDPLPHEFVLDEADGLDWKTLCKCDLIYAAPRSELKRQKGQVIESRRGPLIRTVIGAHAWASVL